VLQKEATLLNSLTSYVNDIKPYHTKLKNVTSELFFEDSMDVAFLDETHSFKVHLQNLWRRSDLGGWRLEDVIDGSRKKYRIPSFLVPKFSLNDKLDESQELAFDPAPLSNNFDSDGFPDGEYPWSRPSSWSHQLGSDIVQFDIPIIKIEPIIVSVNPVGSDPGNKFRATIKYDLEISYNPFNFYGINLNAPSLYEDGTLLSYTTSFTSGTLNKLVRSGPGGAFSKDITITSSDRVFFDLITQASGRVDDSIYLNAFKSKFALTAQKFKLDSNTTTGRYKIPFHNGSRVYVNQILKTFGTDYIIDSTRGFIQFLPSKHPINTDKIDINYFVVDRFFISINDPFEYGISYNYDMFGFDMFPFDGLETDISTTLHADNFIVSVNFSKPNFCNPPIFNNMSPEKIKGTITNVKVSTLAGPTDVWKITAIGPKKFEVQKIGSLIKEYAYYNKSFDNGELSFLITNTWVDYFITEENGSYLTYDLSAIGINTAEFKIDHADHFPSLATTVSRANPLSTAYDLAPYGEIKRQVDSTGNQAFFFEFYEMPKNGMLIEFRVEQAEQYNQHVHAAVSEKIKFLDKFYFDDVACSSAPNNRGKMVVGFDIPDFDVLDYDDGLTVTYPIQLTTTSGIDAIALTPTTCLRSIESPELSGVFYPSLEDNCKFSIKIGSNVVDGITPVPTVPYSKIVSFANLYSSATVYETAFAVHELILVKDVGTVFPTTFPIITVYDGTSLLTLSDYTEITSVVEIIQPDTVTTNYGIEIRITLTSLGTYATPATNSKNLIVLLE
jgi:hypothetical protein